LNSCGQKYCRQFRVLDVVRVRELLADDGLEMSWSAGLGAPSEAAGQAPYEARAATAAWMLLFQDGSTHSWLPDTEENLSSRWTMPRTYHLDLSDRGRRHDVEPCKGFLTDQRLVKVPDREASITIPEQLVHPAELSRASRKRLTKTPQKPVDDACVVPQTRDERYGHFTRSQTWTDRALSPRLQAIDMTQY
jgi:hypothetical protein